MTTGTAIFQKLQCAIYICVLQEMIEIRTGSKKCDNFSLEEVQIIIEDICLK